jgi:hypothetical protein
MFWHGTKANRTCRTTLNFLGWWRTCSLELKLGTAKNFSDQILLEQTSIVAGYLCGNKTSVRRNWHLHHLIHNVGPLVISWFITHLTIVITSINPPVIVVINAPTELSNVGPTSQGHMSFLGSLSFTILEPGSPALDCSRWWPKGPSAQLGQWTSEPGPNKQKQTQSTPLSHKKMHFAIFFW